MNITPETIKKHLSDTIDQLMKNRDLYLNKPEKAFTRTQKLTFHDTMLFPIVAAEESTYIEMLDYFSEAALPSQAAMNYRRNQIKVLAFRDLFLNFAAKLPQDKTFHGMRLIACDGTRLGTPYNPKDKDSFVNCIKERRGFNQYHLNTFYDVMNDIYVDAVIQGYFSMNEKLAFCEMVDRFPKEKKAIFVADRGYASFNVIAHAIHSGHHFVIRLPNPMARNIFCSDKDAFDDSVLDWEDDIYIGRTRNKETRKLRNYHYITTNKPYDSVPKGSKEIDCFHVRMVKIELPSGKKEYLLTNLPQSQFSLSDLNEIYRLRWGIEVSYRYLKYASGMIHVHSLKQDFIFQEILAKLTCYNFCAAVLSIINAPIKKKQKYKYTLEKTYVIKCCMRYLKNEVENLKNLLTKRKVPVRADRNFKRNIRRQHSDTLQYR